METTLGILIFSIVYLVLYVVPFMLGYQEAQWKPILKIMLGLMIPVVLILLSDAALAFVLFMMSFALMLFVGLPLTGIIFGTIAGKATEKTSNKKMKVAINTAIFFLPKVLLFSGLAAVQAIN